MRVNRRNDVDSRQRLSTHLLFVLTFCMMCCGLIPNSRKAEIIWVGFKSILEFRWLSNLLAMAAHHRTHFQYKYFADRNQPVRICFLKPATDREMIRQIVKSWKTVLELLAWHSQSFEIFCWNINLSVTIVKRNIHEAYNSCPNSGTSKWKSWLWLLPCPWPSQ